MAEFDPIPPEDAAEAAYRQALLGDEAGREQRRARLMAALPRPEPAVATPVARNELAWRWQPYAWGLAATGLLLAAVLVLKGRPAEPGPTLDPRLAAAPTASAPVVVAQADPPVVPPPQAQVAEAPPAAAKAAAAKPRLMEPAPVVVADASLSRERRETATAVATATESARLALEPPPAAAPPMAAAQVAPSPPAAPAVAAAPMVPLPRSKQAEALARADAAAGMASAHAPMSLASEAAPVKLMTLPEHALLAAVKHADLPAARSALQAGASAHLRDTQGRTVLMLAARTGSGEVVDLLLAAGARKADRDPQGWTAADHARDVGRDALLETLR